MKTLKQTKLSFTPVPKTSDASPRSSQHSPSASKDATAKSQRSQKTTSTKRPGRAAMDCVEIPPPPKRSVRIKASSNSASPSHSSTSKVAMSAQARKPSLKRKLSPPLDAEAECFREVVHIPRIAVDLASSPAAGQSSRQKRPLLPKDNNLSVAGKDKRTPSYKKLRLSSPISDLTPLASSSVHDTDVDDNQFVPTSQSEEQELTLPRDPLRKDPASVQESVDKWRKETLASRPSRSASPAATIPSSPFSELSEIPMDVDFNPLSPPGDVLKTIATERRADDYGLQYLHSPCSARGVDIRASAKASSSTMVSSTTTPTTPVSRSDREPLQRNSSVPDISPSEAFRSLTPPPSSDTDMVHEPEQEAPQAVEVLDEAKKTARLIADIKARARASVHSSPEQPPLDLDALCDDDSDSSGDEDFATLIEQAKEKAKAAAKATPVASAAEPTQKYNLRRNSPSYKPKTRPTTPPLEVRKSSKKAPIDGLLREKKREERTGKGMVAVRAGEVILAESKARSDVHQEMEEEEEEEEEEEANGSDSDSGWEGGLRVLRGHRRSTSKASSPTVGPWGSQRSSRKSAGSDEENENVNEDQKSNAVSDILAKDMKENMARELAKQMQVPLGVPLWVPMEENDRHASMDVESTLPVLGACLDVSGNAPLQLLKRATEQNDLAQVSALLTSGLFLFLNPVHDPAIIPWLVDLAFSDVNQSLTTLAFTQLVRLAPRVGLRRSGLSLTSVLRVLIRLGGSATILEKYGWTGSYEHRLNVSSHAEERGEMVHRLALLVDTFALSFPTEELSDILLAMVLVGMDPTAPKDLQTEVRKACDGLEQAMGLAQQVELDACKKLVALGRTLSPPNQALLVSFIPGTSTSTVRLARCVARSLLFGTAPSFTEYQKCLPDLWPVIAMLTPESGSGEQFDIPGNANREGYYDDLTCRLSVLSRVLSDVDEYAMMETRATRKAPDPEEGTDKEKEKDKDLEPKLTLLQQVSRSLDLLHGKIVDTRAAHLDRSRAKAAIQRLSFRVHYQRAATLKSREGGKPDLRKYFIRST